MRKETRRRLAEEYRRAALKMVETPQLDKKLFYFSVVFGEAQRMLNLEWDDNLALIHQLAQHAHIQITSMVQSGAHNLLPVDISDIIRALTHATSNLASYFENQSNINELYRVLKVIAKIGYACTGNGSYLYDKGAISFTSENDSEQ